MGAVAEGEVDLHTPSHVWHWVVIIGGVLVLGGAIWGLNSYSSKQDEAKLMGFDSFRAAYAEKCGVASYAGPAPEVMRNAYLGNPAVQTAMDKELAVLKGGAACSDVVAALRKVDFFLPAPGSAP